MKTTQPSWYFVRPNQQVLEKGKEETVVVVLVEEERRELLKDRQKLKNEKHRFLVESKVFACYYSFMFHLTSFTHKYSPRLYPSNNLSSLIAYNQMKKARNL